MAAEVEAYGIDDIMKKYDLHRCNDYAVFCGQGDKWRLKFSCIDDENGREVFDQNIRSIDPGNDATYQIRFYKKVPSSGEIGVGTDYSSSFNFKIRPKVSMPVTGSAGMQTGLSYGDQRYMSRLEDEIRDLKLQLEDLQIENADLQEQIGDQDGKEKKKLGALGQIGAAGEQYPWMQDILKPIVNMATNFFNNNVAAAPMGNIGNIAEKTPLQVRETYNNAIMKMMNYYHGKLGEEKGDLQFAEDMQKLADLTDSPIMFEAAISQLRALK